MNLGRTLIGIGICLILLLVTVVACNNTSTAPTLHTPSGFKIYDGGDFAIPYPEDWTVDDKTSYFGEDVIFCSSSLSPGQQLVAIFLVYKEEPTSVPPEDRFNYFVWSLGEDHPDSAIHSVGQFILGGSEAIKARYTETKPLPGADFLEVVLYREEATWLLRAGVESSEWSNYEDIFDTMINGFCIK